ncbi:MAG TPA: hypothetical protein VHO49_15270 [Anaerolineales bacterium]|nr:hypothetical protein [Anaerolineales bacterium]
MINQTSDGNPFNLRARQIRDQVSTVLKNWGLLPRFKRWRLTQDPATGMVVLFGILNNRYIATHTSIPFGDYFDTRLLQDLSNKLLVQVVSCNSDGLRYAFILDRGRFGKLPTHIDYPFVDNGKVMVRVVYGDNQLPVPSLPVEAAGINDQALVREGVGAFLKVFDDIKVRDDAALLYAKNLPGIVVIDEGEFKKSVAEHEADLQRTQRFRKLFEENTEERNL